MHPSGQYPAGPWSAPGPAPDAPRYVPVGGVPPASWPPPPAPVAVRPGCWTTPIRGGLALRALAWCLLYGVAAAVLAILGIVAWRAATGALPGDAAMVLGLMVPVYAVLPVALYLHTLCPNGLTWADLGFRRPAHSPAHLVWQIPSVLLGGGLAAAAVLALIGVDGSAAQDEQDFSEFSHAGGHIAVAGLLLVAVLVPVVEELVFRGVLLPALRARFTVVPGVLLCGLVFAVVHLLPPALPYLIVVGVSLAAMAEWNRSIVPGIVLHGVNNAVVFALVLGSL